MAEIVRRELVLGGQKSGKSRHAEELARQWLARSGAHMATLVATGRAFDGEMHERIVRHRRERAERVPGLRTVEEPLALAQTLVRLSTAQTLLVVDCLTLWLTNRLMPPPGEVAGAGDVDAARAALCGALAGLPGPVVLVGNEIGLGVIPMGRDVRHFVDELGRLNQSVAAACERVTLMVAGCPLVVKGDV